MIFTSNSDIHSRLGAVALSLLALVSCSSAQDAKALAPGRYVQQVQSGGLTRSFILDVPRRYRADAPEPLVLVFHGWTATAAQAEKYTGMADEGEASNFISVFPDGVGKAWNAGFINLTGQNPDDVQFTVDLLNRLEGELNVDRNREYVCGHSNGAFLANFLGSRLSTRLAAIGSVAGTVGVKDRNVPTPPSPISVILIHGAQDRMVAFDAQSKALLKGVFAEQSAEWWANQDGCSPVPQNSESADKNVVTELFSGGKGDTEVELVTIKNGGHSWPGGWALDPSGKPVREVGTGVSAADLIWQFFKSHPKSGAR